MSKLYYLLSLEQLLKNNTLIYLPHFNVSIRMKKLVNIQRIQMFDITNGNYCLKLDLESDSYSSDRMTKLKAQELHDDLLKFSHDIDLINSLIVK